MLEKRSLLSVLQPYLPRWTKPKGNGFSVLLWVMEIKQQLLWWSYNFSTKNLAFNVFFIEWPSHQDITLLSLHQDCTCMNCTCPQKFHSSAQHLYLDLFCGWSWVSSALFAAFSVFEARIVFGLLATTIVTEATFNIIRQWGAHACALAMYTPCSLHPWWLVFDSLDY